MKLVGYPSRLSVERGGRVEFMVSSQLPSFQARVVRLIHGDTNPDGPGFKEEPVASEIEGEYPGREQAIVNGSYVRIPAAAELAFGGGFTVQAWVWPTTPGKGVQTLIARREEDGGGFALRLVEGRPTLVVGDAEVALETPLQERLWYGLSAEYDPERAEARIWVEPAAATEAYRRASATAPLGAGLEPGEAELTIAAELMPGGAAHFFNGKVDSPRLFASALGGDRRVRPGPAQTEPGAEGLVALWDFAADIASHRVSDRSGNGHHGRTVNKPTRGVTGWNWDGSQTAWPAAPEQYGAIHFHDDDLDDAGWEPAFGWEVPADLASGVYAVHLTGGEEDDEDYVPFFVRPKRGEPTASIVFVSPTFSHLAYANQHLLDGETVREIGASGSAAEQWPSTPQDKYVVENRLNSLYDAHSDGSGVCYASRLRPLVTQRPKYRSPTLNEGEGTPHQFNADLCLIDWLHERGYEFDVITDEDLHEEGAELLRPYRVVVTGSHHEYWSAEMIDAAQDYLVGGGRMMYLAGNGMYWVTQHDRETKATIEIRRAGPSTRTWEPDPGENHLSETGELGGIWRYRGKSPQSWLGVGMASQGLGAGRPYERQPDSFDPRASWVFEGVGEEELIGDFPCLVNGYGAAGFEIDRYDRALGSPERTFLLASATGFSDSFQHVIEEVLVSNSMQGGTVSPEVRADITLLDYPNGGGVFSVGSISWTGCLSYNGYDNNVARITANVLDRFASEAPAVLDRG
jgi:N,N-dimethylformamidase